MRDRRLILLWALMLLASLVLTHSVWADGGTAAARCMPPVSTGVQVDNQLPTTFVQLSSVRMVQLPNGLRAVDFWVARPPSEYNRNWRIKLRYRLQWYDACGKPVGMMPNPLGGFILNPGERRSVQAVAPGAAAISASLQIYTER